MTADDFRKLALALPGAVEGAHHGHADFRVNGRVFASLGPDEAWAMVKLLPHQQQSVAAARPAAFQPFNGAWGRGGATRVNLETCPKTEARKALRAAWEHVAPVGRPPTRPAPSVAPPRANPAADADAERQLAAFLDQYLPETAALARALRARLGRRLRRAVQLVYDNYNFLVIGFSPTARPSDAPLSLAVAPRHVNLCFLRGVGLPDPQKRLRGQGSQVRSLRFTRATDFDDPYVRRLIDAAWSRAPRPGGADAGQVIIRSVSVRKRPRRPGVLQAG